VDSVRRGQLMTVRVDRANQRITDPGLEARGITFADSVNTLTGVAEV
jgi:hypothetical protein